MKFFNSKMIIPFALLTSFGVYADMELSDVVYVAAPKPFYIKIFEASKGDAVAAGVKSGYGSSRVNKPDRMTEYEAAAYCESIDMELATKEQWLQAGSNLGRNLKYTLVGDEITKNGKKLANINSSDSVVLSDITTIGIDSIGTMGMTGNRAEWVNTAPDEYGQCGGSYETKSNESVKLSNICRESAYDSSTATARCVYVLEEEEEVVVTFSSRVKGALKTYLSELGISAAVAQEKIVESILDLLIGKNHYTDSDKNDESLLEMTLPSEDDEDEK